MTLSGDPVPVAVVGALTIAAGVYCIIRRRELVDGMLSTWRVSQDLRWAKALYAWALFAMSLFLVFGVGCLVIAAALALNG